MTRTPFEFACLTIGAKTSFAIAKFSLTGLFQSRPMNVPTLGTPSAAAASMHAMTCELISSRWL